MHIIFYIFFKLIKFDFNIVDGPDTMVSNYTTTDFSTKTSLEGQVKSANIYFNLG